ncbi:leucinerich repeat kinase [Pelomyxa schiedti]|nr:leucinerich repeat kinase [Pelomyxa schiedti]
MMFTTGATLSSADPEIGPASKTIRVGGKSFQIHVECLPNTVLDDSGTHSHGHSHSRNLSKVLTQKQTHVVVVVLSMLDYKATDTLSSTLIHIRDHFPMSKTKLLLCVIDYDASLLWCHGGDKAVVSQRAEMEGIDATGLNERGCLTWNIISPALDCIGLSAPLASSGSLGSVGSLSSSSNLTSSATCGSTSMCGMVRVVQIRDKLSVKGMFEDVVSLHLMKKKKTTWKQSLPTFKVDVPAILLEKIPPTIKKRGLNDEDYEQIDKNIHAALSQGACLSDLLVYLIENELIADTRALVCALSHFPQGGVIAASGSCTTLASSRNVSSLGTSRDQTWIDSLHPTYHLVLDPTLTDFPARVREWVEAHHVDLPAKVPTDISLPFFMLEAIPKQLVCHQSLTKLDLSHNTLSNIPPEFFENCKALQILDLSFNRITSIPDTVSSVGNLTSFNIEHNEIESLPVSIGDCVQMILYCGFNKIAALPHSLAHHARLSKVHYQPNPLQNMPAQSISSPHDLAQFLEEQSLHESSTRWARMKLVVVGPENVGKTTLLRRFQGKLHDGISTDGISIKDLQIRELTFAAWDFGGQAVFLPTHQFFLTGRALYLVVFDLANPNGHRIEYWLRQISKTVKVPPSPPVILVGTRADRLPSMEKAQSICSSLHQQFKCIGSPIACIPVDAKEGDLTCLEDAIMKVAITKHMILREKVPGNWIHLDKILTVKRRTTQTVPWGEFTELAAQADITDPSKLKQAAQFLHGVGSIIYYESSYSKLGDIVILDPEYLASVMSTIVTFKTTMIVNGVLSKEGLLQIWHNYDPSQHQMLIELLSLFLILHPITTPEGKEAYLVPCALVEKVPPEATSLWPPQPPPKFVEYDRRFVFPCLPIGLFGRLLVRVLHTTGLGAKCFWKDNMRFEFTPQADARSQYGYVEFECNTGTTPSLCVRVRQAEDSKPILLAQMLEIVDTTIDCFYKTIQLDVRRYITCNHCPLPLSPNIPLPYMFTYEEVVTAISQKATPTCKVEGIHLRLNTFVPELMLNNETQILPESLTNLQVIGAGGFGKIYKGEMDGKIVAVKELIVKQQGEAAERFAEFKQEVSLMSMLDSPYIVKLFGVCMNPPMMVMEFIPHGDLFKLLHAIPPEGETGTMLEQIVIPGLEQYPWLERYPPGDEKFKYPMNWHFRLLLALDIARGLSYLHTLHPPVVHRDLRSPNVFIQNVDPSALVRAKVADFGLSVRVAGKVAGVLSTWQWLAPEMIDAQSDGYDEQADVFSLGIVMYEIVTRQYPYDEYAELPQYSRRKGDSFEWREQNMKSAIAHDGLRPTIPSYVPSEFASIISSCWGKYPSDRPTSTQIACNLASLLSQQRSSASQEQELAPLVEPTKLWELDIGEQKIWSVTEDSQGWPWAGFADGTVRNMLLSTGEVGNKVINLEHKTRIYSLLSVDGDLWASSEFGKIFVLDMAKLRIKAEIPAHGEKGSIANLFGVYDPRNANSSMRVWSASATESTVVIVDPKTQEVVNRLALDPETKMTSIAQCGHLIWLGCWKRILTLDCSTMETHRLILPPIMGKYMCATAICNRVWFGVQSKVVIYNSEQLNCVATLLGHEDDVSAICQCNGYGWSADKKGIIIAWNPTTLISVKKLELNDYLISNLCSLSNCLWYTAIHPKSCVGTYYFGTKPEPKEQIREVEENLIMDSAGLEVHTDSSPPLVLSLALDTPATASADSASVPQTSGFSSSSKLHHRPKATSFTIRKSRTKLEEEIDMTSPTVASLLLDPVPQLHPRQNRRSVLLTAQNGEGELTTVTSACSKASFCIVSGSSSSTTLHATANTTHLASSNATHNSSTHSTCFTSATTTTSIPSSSSCTLTSATATHNPHTSPPFPLHAHQQYPQHAIRRQFCHPQAVSAAHVYPQSTPASPHGSGPAGAPHAPAGPRLQPQPSQLHRPAAALVRHDPAAASAPALDLPTSHSHDHDRYRIAILVVIPARTARLCPIHPISAAYPAARDSSGQATPAPRPSSIHPRLVIIIFFSVVVAASQLPSTATFASALRDPKSPHCNTTKDSTSSYTSRYDSAAIKE